MPLTMRADSTEFATATITADHDITGDHIDVALPATTTAPTSWYPAEILDVTPVGSGRYRATYRILIGPNGGATQLTAGNYDWTVRLTDIPETPIRKAGVVTITPT